MGDTQRQRQEFEFVRDHFHSQEPFTREEFQAAIPDWAPNSVKTYWSKQIKRLVAPAGHKKFRVTEAFRPFASWPSFRKRDCLRNCVNAH